MKLNAKYTAYAAVEVNDSEVQSMMELELAKRDVYNAVVSGEITLLDVKNKVLCKLISSNPFPTDVYCYRVDDCWQITKAAQ